MVTWTFDAMALIVGICIGVVVSGFVICFVMWKDGSWDRGFSEGWNAKHDYETTQHGGVAQTGRMTKPPDTVAEERRKTLSRN